MTQIRVICGLLHSRTDFGGSFAVMGSVQIDGQYTGGSDKALRGWGIAGRVVF